MPPLDPRMNLVCSEFKKIVPYTISPYLQVGMVTQPFIFHKTLKAEYVIVVHKTN